jgi:4-amino-4-deoxy-L-arabinose transferase-like glycosyltransferase
MGFAWGIVGGLVVVKLALHFGVNLFGPYEFHRDEFLYMAMGEHLRLWGMDFPPFIALVAEISRGLLGDSLFAVRFFPALFSAALLVLTAAVTQEMGGGRMSQALAALFVFAHILFLRSGNLFQPVVFDQVWWTVALLALARLGNTDDRRWWLLFGVSCGLGLLSKFSILVFGLAALIGLVVSARRRDLLSPWPWYAALIAFAIGSPSIVGQIQLGFPVLDQMGDLRGAQLARVTPGGFLMGQLQWGPQGVVALAGLIALLFHHGLRSFRLVGWTCLSALVLLMVLHGKPYYAGPVHPTLMAAGAILLERFAVPRWSTILRGAVVIAVVGYCLITFPLSLPILRPPLMVRYLAWLGSEGAVTTNVGAVERLPQDFADMLGWEPQVDAVAQVFHSLDQAEREQAVILGSNYGEAGAIDFYGPRRGLPPAIAYVGTYWFFGPGDKPGQVLIAIGFTYEDLADFFAVVTPAAHVVNHYAVAEQRDLFVYVCREPTQTIQEVWPSLAGEQ